MDFLKSQVLDALALRCAAVLLLASGGAVAQVPYAIDGTVPDADCCAEFQDPVGSVDELGPLNSSTTKLGVIHTAAPPMLGFTNPNGATDLATIWLDTRKDASGDIWLYFAWQRESNTGSSVIAIKAASDAA